MGKYKYAMFDMDGTLVDTMGYWRNCVYEMAQRSGIKDIDADVKENLLKMSCAKGVEYLKSIYKDACDLINFSRKDILKNMEYHYVNHTTIRQGVRELLKRLRYQGIPMCIVSATPTRLVEIALDKVNIKEYFDFIITNDDFPKGKQEADIFYEMLNRFGSKPEETAVFEDALYSIKTAKSLGLYIVGVEDIYEKRHKEKILSLCDEYVAAPYYFEKRFKKIV